jgi:Holliday junction resolvasome RuvABC endonuclease subunit
MQAVLAIDPGLSSVGVAVVTWDAPGQPEGATVRLVRTLRTNTDDERAERLTKVCGALLELARGFASEWAPRCRPRFAVENQVGAIVGAMRRRQCNAAALASLEVVGAVRLAALACGGELVLVEPQDAHSIAGKGSSKADVRAAVARLTAGARARNEHEADAVAIALAAAAVEP